jgi:hypothetical protein
MNPLRPQSSLSFVQTSHILRMTTLLSTRLLLRAPKELRYLILAASQPQTRHYASAPPTARLNVPTDFSTTSLLHHTSSSALSNPELPESMQRSSKTSRLTLHESINASLRHALTVDDSVIVFGEDVSFGGVFRCSAGLAADFGSARVFNTPLTEQGIVGFAIGAAAQGMRPVAEIQFADYVYPAFDQLVNEAAKGRYKAGTTGMHCGGMVVRMPCGGVGHGALYVFSFLLSSSSYCRRNRKLTRKPKDTTPNLPSPSSPTSLAFASSCHALPLRRKASS